MTADVSVDKEHKKLSIVVRFEAAQYSERYQVSIQSHGFHYLKNVSKVTECDLVLVYYEILWHYSTPDIKTHCSLCHFLQQIGKQNITERNT